MEQKLKADWPGPIRLLFKFLFLYMVFYAFPVQMLYQDVIIWFGQYVLGVEGRINTAPTGSGDTLYNWISLLFHLLIAFLGTIIWTAVDRNRKSYPLTADGLYIMTRYYLAMVLLGYGISKVFPMQFPQPNLVRLTQEFGDASPMGLAWTFLGHSTGYQIFAGFMEVLAAVLLFFRRTTLIGALVTIGVMTNVFMINIFFDVPVKLFSAHLLVIAVCLAGLNLKPLWNFLVMDRSVKKNSFTFPVQDRGWRIISYCIKAVVIVGLLGYQIYFIGNRFISQPDPPEIGGVYDVIDFEVSGEYLAPHATDKKRWQRVIIDNRYPGLIAIDYMTGDRVRFRSDLSADVDSITANVPINPAYTHRSRSQLNVGWQRPLEKELVLRGTLGKDSLFVRLEKQDADDILLMNRGFNWVNEFPFNR